MNFLFNPPDIDILLSDVRSRKSVEIKVDDSGKRERQPLFYDGESIAGKVNFTLKNNKPFDHNGIKIEFIGLIQTFNDRTSSHEFLSLSKELARAGELSHSNSCSFEFREVEKPYETYYGASVKLRYFLRVTINKLLSNITKEMGIAVHAMSYYPITLLPDPGLKTEVGIEDSLHIEFEYDKPRYHLKDVIVGKVYFLVIRLKLKSMEIELLRKEITGAQNSSSYSSGALVERTDYILKYEVMDGSPNKGETVPIRIFLAGYDLQPTMRDIAKMFSVKYYLNLVLIDEDDRRYYKTREIQLWRRWDKFYRTYRNVDSSHSSSVGGASERTSDRHSHLARNQNPPPTSCPKQGGETATTTAKQQHVITKTAAGVSGASTQDDHEEVLPPVVTGCPSQVTNPNTCNSETDNAAQVEENDENKESMDCRDVLENSAVALKDDRNLEYTDIGESGKEMTTSEISDLQSAA